MPERSREKVQMAGPDADAADGVEMSRRARCLQSAIGTRPTPQGGCAERLAENMKGGAAVPELQVQDHQVKLSGVALTLKRGQCWPLVWRGQYRPWVMWCDYLPRTIS